MKIVPYELDFVTSGCTASEPFIVGPRAALFLLFCVPLKLSFIIITNGLAKHLFIIVVCGVCVCGLTDTCAHRQPHIPIFHRHNALPSSLP